MARATVWHRGARRTPGDRVPRIRPADVPAGIDAGTGSDLAAAALGLARRFGAGGTLWCVAPSHPEHARHVAVEFVHPVVMGTRALAAVAVDGPDPVATLRAVTRSGDVLLVVGPADDVAAADSVRRAPAWGLATIWIGAGPRPPAGAADHVLWVDEHETATAPFDGRLVLRYHLLWELTHVCFEHPGLLGAEPDDCGDNGTCITCADEGRYAEVETAGGDGLTTVRTARGRERVDTSLVGDVRPGDLLVVHAGTAIELLGGGR
jgi:hypothetical protein